MNDREIRLVLNGKDIITLREGETAEVRVWGDVAGQSVPITLATLELLP